MLFLVFLFYFLFASLRGRTNFFFIRFFAKFFLLNYFLFFSPKQFNSIGDFTVNNKCVHTNDVCDLQTSNAKNVENEKQSSVCDKESSTAGYVTANCLMRKSAGEYSISDSILSLKNYSAILHSSNVTFCKQQSPNSMAKALERQTSTPMQQQLYVFKSPEDPSSNACSRSCSTSSGHSSQLSSIHSSCSESDPSSQSNSIAESNENRYGNKIFLCRFCFEIDSCFDCFFFRNFVAGVRHDVHQQSIVVTQKKTTTIKRSNKSLAMTPLTRQVMTKSIHRAILEYQHAQCGTAVVSPRSPLDLRTSFVIRRDTSKNTSGVFVLSPESEEKEISPKVRSKLETVYENGKDGNDEQKEIDEKQNTTIAVVQEDIHAIKETPVAISRKLSAEKIDSGGCGNGEVWFTPKEVVPSTKMIEIENDKVKIRNFFLRFFRSSLTLLSILLRFTHPKWSKSEQLYWMKVTEKRTPAHCSHQ